MYLLHGCCRIRRRCRRRRIRDWARPSGAGVAGRGHGRLSPARAVIPAAGRRGSTTSGSVRASIRLKPWSGWCSGCGAITPRRPCQHRMSYSIAVGGGPRNRRPARAARVIFVSQFDTSSTVATGRSMRRRSTQQACGMMGLGRRQSGKYRYRVFADWFAPLVTRWLPLVIRTARQCKRRGRFQRKTFGFPNRGSLTGSKRTVAHYI